MALVSVSSGIGAWLMTLGMLAVPCSGPLAFVAAVVAVVTGHISRAQLRRGDGRSGDTQLVMIGLVAGYLHLAITVILLVVVITMMMAGMTWGMLFERFLGP